MKTRLKTLAAYALCLTILCSTVIPAFAKTDYEAKIDSYSRSINALTVYDVTQQKMLYGKNENKHIYIASTTKLMTCLVALSVFHPDDIIVVGNEINLRKPNSSLSFILPGHKLRVRTLIAALLLPSGNDAAYTVAVNTARKHSGDMNMGYERAVNYFCNLMNEKARALGCNDTYFVNPEGWDNSYHYSTASDMTKIACAALNNALITSIANIHKNRYTFVSGEWIEWSNTNKLLDPESSYYYEYAHGLKTGTTPAAGKCLVAFAEKDGRKLLICAYGCATEDDRYARVRDIFTYSFSFLEQQALLEETTTAPPPEEETTTANPEKGDVDANGSVTATDARLVLRAAVGLEDAAGSILKYGDADKDGKITSSDARLILRASVGLEDLNSIREEASSESGTEAEEAPASTEDTLTSEISEATALTEEAASAEEAAA